MRVSTDIGWIISFVFVKKSNPVNIHFLNAEALFFQPLTYSHVFNTL